MAETIISHHITCVIWFIL